MRRSRRSIPVAAAMLAALSSFAGAQTSSTAGPYIETVAAAEVRVAPDRVTITLSVETKGASAAMVASANARTQRAILDTLGRLGLRAPMVTTQSFNVAPNYEAVPEKGMRQAGYVTRNSVTARLTDLTLIGAVIDAALSRGATGVGNLEFGSSAADSASRAATRLAVAKARAQAEAMADALGGELGPLVQSSTAAGDPRTYMSLRGVAGGSTSTPITPSDVVVTASVSARWQFVPRR